MEGEGGGGWRGMEGDGGRMGDGGWRDGGKLGALSGAGGEALTGLMLAGHHAEYLGLWGSPALEGAAALCSPIAQH